MSRRFDLVRHDAMRLCVNVDLERELDRLAQLDEHIAEAEQRLIDQIQHADDLREKGGDAETIKSAISALDSMLIEWRTQRDTVAERVQALRRGS